MVIPVQEATSQCVNTPVVPRDLCSSSMDKSG
jgi:hypothetical protein